jgi:hypothetical protein
MRLWAPISRGDMKAILICIAILVLFFISALTIQNRLNLGFGSEWDCTSIAQGDRLCMLKKATPEQVPR